MTLVPVAIWDEVVPHRDSRGGGWTAEETFSRRSMSDILRRPRLAVRESGLRTGERDEEAIGRQNEARYSRYLRQRSPDVERLMTTPAFALARVYAYTVRPQRHEEESDVGAPQGGTIKVTPQLRTVIAAAFKKIDARTLTNVDFETDDDRKHDVREDIMAVAFGASQAPKTAAARLAARLSRTMDHRSHAGLLLLAVESSEPKQRVSMLLLPHEEVVQFGGPAEDLILSLVQNAFSTGSGLRKLARLEGHNARTQFLSVEILDLQIMSQQKSIADFWIRDFLHARPRMDAATGSKRLAAALQRAFAAAPDEDRDAVFSAILKAGSGMVKKTSLARYAEEVPANLREAFFHDENDEVRRAVFDVDPTLVRTSRIITGKDGVVISAPAETLGKSVVVSQSATSRVVKYTGVVEKERVVRVLAKRSS